MQMWRSCRRSRGREPNRRAGLNGRVYCWVTAKIRLSLPSRGLWDCIIRRFSGVLSGPLPTARSRRSTIVRGRAKSPAEAKAWLVSLACRKAKDLGYPHELWTTRLLARHAREHGPAEGHACLDKLVQGTVCKILDEQEVKPHKVRYYLERRDPEFKEKMAEVLCVYRQVRILKETAAKSNTKPSDAVAIVSY